MHIYYYCCFLRQKDHTRPDRDARHMFDPSDAGFRQTSAAPRLGPPALTASGRMSFISEDRFVFDQHNAEFQATSAQPRLLPPVLKGRTHVVIASAR